MVEAHVGGRQRPFDSGHQAARKERTLSPWTKPLIPEIIIALPSSGNRYEREAEPGTRGERKQSPWGKPLLKENVSASPAGGNWNERHEEPGREEKIMQINDRLSDLGAANEKAKKWSGGKEREETGRAENVWKEDDGRIKCEMSYAQCLRVIRGVRQQDYKPLILKEAQHPVLEAVDMVFDLNTWLIGLFLSPILEEFERKWKKKEEQNEEDESFVDNLIKRLLSPFLKEWEQAGNGHRFSFSGGGEGKKAA